MTSIYINKRGSKLSIKNGLFNVALEKEHHTFAVDAVKEISISKSTSITSDAILTAAAHGIDIIFTLPDGVPKARIWSNKFGSIATVRKHQMIFAQSTDGLAWIGNILARKLRNQSTFLQMLGAGNSAFDFSKAISQIELSESKILALTQVDGSLEECSASLRGLEGKAGMYYFRSLSATLPEMYQFKKRSSRPALDIFNALLNYAYGIFYSKTESALLKAGIDPAIGLMHRDEYNRPVFTYDFIEPFRIWAEVVVFNLCAQQVIYPDFFDQSNGGFWLNDYGKRILISSIYDYINEIVTIENLSRTRIEHLNIEARELAKTLRNYKPSED